MSVKGYNKYNESRGSKGRRSTTPSRNDRFNRQQHAWQDEVPKFTNRIETRGMNMEFAPRFKYVITKIAEKGNAIAKELLLLPNKPEAKFENSYLDLTNRFDTISYLQNAERNLSDEEKYKSNKRQQSKAYKVIKTIFGSKYTKFEVTKFVSMFKQVYEQGPEKKGDASEKPKQTVEEVIKKISEDTKSGKLKWEKQPKAGNLVKYETRIKITDKKSLVFIFFHFDNNTKEEKWSFITTNIYNELGKTDDEKRKFLQNIAYDKIGEFLKIFKDKYKITVSE